MGAELISITRLTWYSGYWVINGIQRQRYYSTSHHDSHISQMISPHENLISSRSSSSNGPERYSLVIQHHLDLSQYFILELTDKSQSQRCFGLQDSDILVAVYAVPTLCLQIRRSNASLSVYLETAVWTAIEGDISESASSSLGDIYRWP